MPSSPHGCARRIKRQEAMRATSMMRFIILGAVGFGIGVVIAGAGFLIPVGGAFGGASLGLALEDKTKVAILTPLGALGATLGVIVVFIAGSPVWDYPLRMTAVIGAMVGASLGAGFWDWKRLVALTLAGAVGFGVGGAIGGDSPSGLLALGVIGGASLGAALGYLEKRRLGAELEPTQGE
jgi:hypothetical protein